MQPESSVLSGCINNTGVLTIEVTKEFEDSTVAKILIWWKMQAARKANAEKLYWQSLQDTILPSL